MKVSGILKKKKIGKGSKQEHIAYCIVTPTEEEIIVKLKSDNPFENSTLEEMDGEQVIATGKMLDYLLLATKVKKCK
jgi:hypothetical protein